MTLICFSDTSGCLHTDCSRRSYFSFFMLFFRAGNLGNSNEGCTDRYWAQWPQTWGKICRALCRGQWDAFATVLDLQEFIPPDTLLIFLHQWLTFSQHVDEGVNDILPVRGLMIPDSDSMESPSSCGMLTPQWQVLHGLLKVAVWEGITGNAKDLGVH